MFVAIRRAASSLGVVGAGQMGTGIALVGASVAGLPVQVLDSNQAQCDRSKAFIDSWIKKEVEKGRLANPDEVKRRISFTTSYAELAQADFIIEAIVENAEVKAKLCSVLSPLLKPEAIFASNTSSISITKVASFCAKPENVIGMHFMNPVPVMKLVEVIRGLQTSDATLEKTLALAAKMKKVTTLSSDRPGFIANRVLMPYINEAIQVLNEGIATKEDIDQTMKLGTNVPMGPLTLADFIGLDTCLSIMNVLHREFGDSKYRPSPLLVNYVNAGWLGKKTGRGFYEYKK